MRSLLTGLLALAALSFPPLSVASGVVECAGDLTLDAGAGVTGFANDVGAYGPVEAAGRFATWELAVVEAQGECEGGVIYCLEEWVRPECDICLVISSASLTTVNCCDRPIRDVPYAITEGYCNPQYDGCGSNGHVALGTLTLDTPAGTFYVDDRNFVQGNGFWVYAESNGEAGLQRGDEQCVESEDADRVIF